MHLDMTQNIIQQFQKDVTELTRRIQALEKNFELVLQAFQVTNEVIESRLQKLEGAGNVIDGSSSSTGASFRTTAEVREYNEEGKDL